jgi:hypothetical protein
MSHFLFGIMGRDNLFDWAGSKKIPQQAAVNHGEGSPK